MTDAVDSYPVGLNVLNEQQQAAKQRKLTETLIQILKLLIRIGGVIISGVILNSADSREKQVDGKGL